MIEKFERSKADRNLTIIILLLGPVISFIGWMLFGNYIIAGLGGYIFVSVSMILLFAIWAWMGRPPTEFM